MKRPIVLAVTALLMCSSLGITAAAEEISETAETPITIQIMERDLAIKSVETPSFGQVSLNSKVQTVTSKKDLVIQVHDKRQKMSPWKLTYSFTPATIQELLEEPVGYKVDAGNLSVVDADGKTKAVPTAEYQSHAFDNQTKLIKTGELVQLTELSHTNETLYEYRVPKESISFEIPAGTKPGNYDGTQTIHLYDVPN